MNARDILRQLRNERIRRAIPVKEIASILGIERTTFNRWERGLYRKIDLDRIVLYAEWLGLQSLLAGFRPDEAEQERALERLQKFMSLYAISRHPQRLTRYTEDDLELLEAVVSKIEDRQPAFKGRKKTDGDKAR